MLPSLVRSQAAHLSTATATGPWPCKVTTHWDWWRAGHSGKSETLRQQLKANVHPPNWPNLT